MNIRNVNENVAVATNWYKIHKLKFESKKVLKINKNKAIYI